MFEQNGAVLGYGMAATRFSTEHGRPGIRPEHSLLQAA